MKKIISFILLLTFFSIKAQTVIDFENNSQIQNFTVLTSNISGQDVYCNPIPLENPLSSSTINTENLTGSINPEANANFPSSNYRATLVTNQTDAQIESFPQTGCQDANCFTTMSMVNNGNRALRINQNVGFGGSANGTADNAEIDAVKFFFRPNTQQISFSYAAVFEHGGGTPGDHKQAYFRAVINCTSCENPGQIYEFCLNADEINNNNGVLLNGDDLRVKPWTTNTFNINPQYLGHELEFRFEVADCNEEIHGGYVYVDDITFNGEIIDDPCESICNQEPEPSITNLPASFINPECVRKLTYNNTTCNDLNYSWQDANGTVLSTINSIIYDFSQPTSTALTLFINDPINNCTVSTTFDIPEGCNENTCPEPCELFNDPITFPDISATNTEACIYDYTIDSGVQPCDGGYFEYKWRIYDEFSNELWNSGIIQSSLATSSLNNFDFQNYEIGNYNIGVQITYFNSQGQKQCGINKGLHQSITCGSTCNACDFEYDFKMAIFNQKVGCSYQFLPEIENSCSLATYSYEWRLPDLYGNTVLSTDFAFYIEHNSSTPLTHKVNLTILKNPINQKPCTEKVIEKTYQTSNCQFYKNDTKKQKISISPNPVKNGELIIISGIDMEDINSIEVLDIYGELNMRVKPKENTILLEHLKTGIYFIKIYTSYGIETKKIIVD